MMHYCGAPFVDVSKTLNWLVIYKAGQKYFCGANNFVAGNGH